MDTNIFKISLAHILYKITDSQSWNFLESKREIHATVEFRNSEALLLFCTVFLRGEMTGSYEFFFCFGFGKIVSLSFVFESKIAVKFNLSSAFSDSPEKQSHHFWEKYEREYERNLVTYEKVRWGVNVFRVEFFDKYFKRPLLGGGVYCTQWNEL